MDIGVYPDLYQFTTHLTFHLNKKVNDVYLFPILNFFIETDVKSFKMIFEKDISGTIHQSFLNEINVLIHLFKTIKRSVLYKKMRRRKIQIILNRFLNQAATLKTLNEKIDQLEFIMTYIEIK